MDPELYDKLTKFVDKHYQGNKSLMIKIAIEEFIDNYAAEGSSRFEKIEKELEALKSDILEIKNSIRGLVLKIEEED